jgi:hypothetical protein
MKSCLQILMGTDLSMETPEKILMGFGSEDWPVVYGDVWEPCALLGGKTGKVPFRLTRNLQV